MQHAHHWFTEIINRFPLKTPSKLLEAGWGSAQEGQCYSYSREWICFQCTWQAFAQAHDDISHSQDHTCIFTCSCKSVGQPIHMVYTLLPLSQEGIQLFLSLDMHMAKYNDIPCAKEEKERLKFFSMLSLFLAVSLSHCAYSLFPWKNEGPSRNFCSCEA